MPPKYYFRFIGYTLIIPDIFLKFRCPTIYNLVLLILGKLHYDRIYLQRNPRTN